MKALCVLNVALTLALVFFTIHDLAHPLPRECPQPRDQGEVVTIYATADGFGGLKPEVRIQQLGLMKGETP